MKWRAVALGFLFLIVLLFPSVRADWVFEQTLYDDVHLFIARPTPYPHHWAVNFTIAEGDKVEVTFESSAIVEFWISDYENYEAFKGCIGESWPYLCFSVYSYQAPVTSWEGEFEFPKTDEWYFVFVNEYNPTENRTIQLTLNHYQWIAPLITPELVLGFAGISVLVGVVFLGVILWRRKQQAH